MDAETLRQSGIYTITNRETGRIYVGSAVRLGHRLWRHRWMLRKNQHPSVILQRAWNKYGEDAFVFAVAELVPDKANLIVREQSLIDQLQSFGPRGYNLTPNAGSQLGFKMSDESKAKMRAAKLGKPRPFTDQHRANLSQAMKGKAPSESTKTAQRKAITGKKRSPESIEMQLTTKRRLGLIRKTPPRKCPSRGRLLSTEHLAALRKGYARRMQLKGKLGGIQLVFRF